VKQILAPAMAMAWMVSQKHPLRGLEGGDDAAPYANRVLVGTPEEYEVDNAIQAQLPAGAITAYQYGGGAGFGPALERDPQQVLEDVLDEYVTMGAAHDRYGVVLTGTLEALDLEVDEPATQQRRERLRATQQAGQGPARSEAAGRAKSQGGARAKSQGGARAKSHG
jgi:N-methylhydantoinase B